jgi:hypothetical protein
MDTILAAYRVALKGGLAGRLRRNYPGGSAPTTPRAAAGDYDQQVCSEPCGTEHASRVPALAFGTGFFTASTFDMRGGRKQVKLACGRPLDGRVRRHWQLHACAERALQPREVRRSIPGYRLGHLMSSIHQRGSVSHLIHFAPQANASLEAKQLAGRRGEPQMMVGPPVNPLSLCQSYSAPISI